MSVDQSTRHDRQEQELLAAFRKIHDDVDREYLVRITKRRAKAQEAPKPSLRLIKSGGDGAVISP